MSTAAHNHQGWWDFSPHQWSGCMHSTSLHWPGRVFILDDDDDDDDVNGKGDEDDHENCYDGNEPFSYASSSRWWGLQGEMPIEEVRHPPVMFWKDYVMFWYVMIMINRMTMTKMMVAMMTANGGIHG